MHRFCITLKKIVYLNFKVIKIALLIIIDSSRDAQVLHFYKNFLLVFPSFANIIEKESIPVLVLDLTKNDEEGFVRASALKCLQEMVRSRNLWHNFLEGQELLVINKQKIKIGVFVLF